MKKQVPQSGKLLIAEPFLGDNNFERSVVLLCEHSALGSFGLVLNQPSNLQLSDVMDTVYKEHRLFYGGPVEQNTLHFIHRLGSRIEDSIDLGNGIFWAGNFDTIRLLINTGELNESNVRLFIGYSGWGKSQLDDECNQNSWIVTEANANLIFETPPTKVWREILKQMGGEFKVLANYPTDPRLN